MAIFRTALLVLLLIGCNQDNGHYQDSQGNQGSLIDGSGRWMIINYWAIWCKPCIKEIPEFNAFARKHSQQVRVFAVNFDQASGEELIAQAKKLGIQFPVLSVDPYIELGYPRPQRLPTTLVFNPEGELIHTLEGMQTEKSLEQAIAR